MPVNLSRVNLNLLVALDVLLKEQNVTKAGQRLFITQSAMSSILKQLRGVFNDELFVRGQSSKMVPTPFALQLRAPLAEFLGKAEKVFAVGKEFNPKTSECVIRIGMSDYAEAVFLPRLIDHLLVHAPHIELDIRHMNYIERVDVFENGEIDLAVGIFDEIPPTLEIQNLYSDEIIILGRRGHPAFAHPIDLKTYAELPQVVIVLFRERALHHTEQVIRQAGLVRKVVASVPHMLSALYAVVHTKENLVCGLPKRLIESLLQKEQFAFAPLPVEGNSLNIVQVWHPRSSDHPANHWIRETIASLAANEVIK